MRYMSPSSKFTTADLIKLLTDHWPLIMQAHAEATSRQTFSGDQVKALKMLSDIGVLNLMWSKTAHDFSEAMANLLGNQAPELLTPEETTELIASLAQQSSKWFTRSIQCNWR